MLKKLVKKVLRSIKATTDSVCQKVIGKVMFKSIVKDLGSKIPDKVIQRQGIRFDVKHISAIVFGSQDNIAVSEIAAVYATSNPDIYVIGVDKTYNKLSSKTKRFVLEHEMAHITHGLANPRAKLSIETKVDITAASIMGLTDKQLRKCLRELKDKVKYLNSRKLMIRRIKNIK